MSNSNLVDVVIESPNCNSPRNDKIRKITIHHMAAIWTVERCGECFASAERIDTRDTNINDFYNGYAGNNKPIDALEVYYYTPEDVIKKSGYKKAVYRVSPVNGEYFDWQHDNEMKNGQDGYAGVFGMPIDRVQIAIE